MLPVASIRSMTTGLKLTALTTVMIIENSLSSNFYDPLHLHHDHEVDSHPFLRIHEKVLLPWVVVLLVRSLLLVQSHLGQIVFFLTRVVCRCVGKNGMMGKVYTSRIWESCDDGECLMFYWVKGRIGLRFGLGYEVIRTLLSLH